MLRSPALAPLSRQHQHVLALCVRIQRAFAPPEPHQQRGSTDPADWQRELAALYENEMRHHFDAEEQIEFPAARRFAELAPLVDRLLAEHQQIRAAITNANDAGRLLDVAALLTAHVRAEENELFEGMQRLLSAAELAALGVQTEAFFAARGLHGPACGLP